MSLVSRRLYQPDIPAFDIQLAQLDDYFRWQRDAILVEALKSQHERLPDAASIILTVTEAGTSRWFTLKVSPDKYNYNVLIWKRFHGDIHVPSKSEFLGAFILLNDALRVERVAVRDPETNLAVSHRTVLSDPLTFRFTLMESKTAGDVSVTAKLTVRRGGTSSEEELNTVRRAMSSSRMLRPDEDVLRMRVKRCSEIYEYLTAQGEASLRLASFTGAVGDVYNEYDIKGVETAIRREEKKHSLEAEIAFLEKKNAELKRRGVKKGTVDWRTVEENKAQIELHKEELAKLVKDIEEDYAEVMEVQNPERQDPSDLPWSKGKKKRSPAPSVEETKKGNEDEDAL
jgi:hypothetical protein